MQVSIETTTGLERKLTVGIPASIVDQEVEKRLKDAAKKVNMKGFRKGKVPFKIVKQQYGRGVRQEVIGDTINRSFYEAVRQKSIRPAGQPSIEPTQMEEGKDIEFVATFEVYPELELKGLDALKVTRYTADITEADVDNMVETLRKNQAQWSEVKRKSKKDDRVEIDFKGTRDGEEFEGGSAKNHTLVLGSGQMIPGFEAGIIGMKTGETQTISVTFPDDYQTESLRGANADFEITVNKVEAQKLPELDDAFFASYGITEGGIEKFREDVKANMEREKEKAARLKVKEQVLNGLLEANQFDIPQALVKGEIDALRNQTLQQYGGMADNIDFKSILPDDLFREKAERRVALGLLISEVVTRENMVADKDVVKNLIEEAASAYEDPQEVINYYYSNQQLLTGVEASALEEQVVDFILSKSKVSEKSVSYEEIIKPLPQEKDKTKNKNKQKKTEKDAE